MSTAGLGLALLAGAELEEQTRKTAEAFGLDQRALAMAWFMFRAGRDDHAKARDLGDLAAAIAGYSQVAAGRPAGPCHPEGVLTMAPDWMNWPGWHGVALVVAYASGGYAGWSIRSTNARSESFALERKILAEKEKAAPAWRIVEALARCKDPLTCPSIDDELEAFRQFTLEAKDLVGDLSKPEPLYGWEQ